MAALRTMKNSYFPERAAGLKSIQREAKENKREREREIFLIQFEEIDTAISEAKSTLRFSSSVSQQISYFA